MVVEAKKYCEHANHLSCDQSISFSRTTLHQNDHLWAYQAAVFSTDFSEAT